MMNDDCSVSAVRTIHRHTLRERQQTRKREWKSQFYLRLLLGIMDDIASAFGESLYYKGAVVVMVAVEYYCCCGGYPK